MNQTALSIVLGLVAGAAGALAVQFMSGGADAGGSGGSGALADNAGIEGRLDRIEALLRRGRPLTAEPALRGSGGGGDASGAAVGAADVDALVARLEERLKPVVQESVKSGLEEAMKEGGKLGPSIEIKQPKKKKVTLAEASAELGLSREEEDAVRRIAGETTDEFFKLITDKDQTVEDVRREFEEAKNDPQKKLGLTTKYMGKALGNLGGLITLGMNHDRKMKEAVGPEKARKLERDYQVTDLDPFGLEDMFNFD